jgi:hypothetical protein
VRTKVSALQHNYSFAETSFRGDDTFPWQDVALPHDFSINRTFSQDNCIYASQPGIDGYKAYLPRNASWYRKSFSLPLDFQGQTIYLEFGGAYQFTEVYLSGIFLMSHRSGYTGFTVRLDNSTSLKYGSEANLLAVHVDPTFGSEWWYVGGGIYRPVSLVMVSPMHFVHKGVFANPHSNGTSIRVSAEIETLEPAGGSTSGAVVSAGIATALVTEVQVRFRLLDETGTTFCQQPHHYHTFRYQHRCGCRGADSGQAA